MFGQGGFEQVATLPTLFSFIGTLIMALVMSPFISSQTVRRKCSNTLPGSTIHAIIVGPLSLVAICGGYVDNYIITESDFGFLTLQLSLGFFLGDFILVLSSKRLRKDKGAIVHHLVSMAGIFYSLYNHGQFIYFSLYRLATELSTPFVNLRLLLHQIGISKSSTWYIMSAVMMAISFFVVRILPIPWHWWVLVTMVTDEASLKVSLIFRICLIAVFVVFDLLNAYWMLSIGKGAVKYMGSLLNKS